MPNTRKELVLFIVLVTGLGGIDLSEVQDGKRFTQVLWRFSIEFREGLFLSSSASNQSNCLLM